MAAKVRVQLTGYQMLSESFFCVDPFSPQQEAHELGAAVHGW